MGTRSSKPAAATRNKARNYYTPLIGDDTPVHLLSTTSRALHDEIMAIGAPFHLVLTELGEGKIMEGFFLVGGKSWTVSCKAANTSCRALFMCRRLRALGASSLVDVHRSHPLIPQG